MLEIVVIIYSNDWTLFCLCNCLKSWQFVCRPVFFLSCQKCFSPHQTPPISFSDLKRKLQSSCSKITICLMTLILEQWHKNCHNILTYYIIFSLLICTQAEPPEDPEKPGGLVQPGLILKYSTYKNLGSIAFQRHDLNKAMEHYLEVRNV